MDPRTTDAPPAVEDDGRAGGDGLATEEPATGDAAEGRDPEFEALLVYLRERRGFDFTGYKRPSLVRRVQRRMAEVGIERVGDYQDHLEVHPDEFTPLFNTILINVTSFFRDRPSWDHLREVLLPQLLSTSGPGIRVWSAGCASGQEAYSVAILLADALGVDEFRRRVKIYATDVDEEALAHARQGAFSERELSGLTPEQVQEYFTTEAGRFAFRKDLRRSLIFGRNDLVQDAPISHVDLLLCRNTLMYFTAETQQRILGRLHYALNPHGVLFLGKAEMLLSHTQLFTPIDLGRRFFHRRNSGPVRERRTASAVFAVAQDGAGADISRLRAEAFLSGPSAQLAVDVDGRLAMVNHEAERVFGLDLRDVGRPFQDLEISYRPVELRTSIAEAVATRRPLWLRGVERPRPGQEPAVFDVQVVPVFREDGGLLGTTVVFDDVTRYRRLQQELEFANHQLETAYEELQSANEELETTNEELQSTVEELETTNEELQSTNEELETMNEELQSMNDELHSTNEELRVSTDEVAGLNRFMSGVLGSFRAGVVVVDPDLRVLVWNSAAEDLWGLREDEVQGRYLLSLDIGLPAGPLHPLLRRQVGGGGEGHDVVELDAVNRRGRPVRVRVTVTAFTQGPAGPAGAVVLMDPTDP
ncbi:CheR family methyltransferase [Geodermatophilus sabuli]|uniref:protein-glutamate O-methyltransferase n=1 Tax=Geodermatophilus sabuli TaxID=1564158 RepID=A0A285EJ02_9ACTN|nr:CheR family methyltransferase [Geodermatophilus sabuli]MBB3083672.1 two-component system CheB/CheR fusion protein [Geodermatophilus sabuli]SNX99102.1 two-component system, chemotaxis family, CheB/CheR fusion protein [Geodermatophilus sabuli]